MKGVFLTVKSKTLIEISSLLLSLILIIFTIFTNSTATVFFAKNTKKVPIYEVATDEKKVALTFDAAWGADKTKQIVDILCAKGVRGTFFLVGFWTEKFPEMVKYIDDHGFEIGTHSATHPKMSTLSAEQIKNELTSSSKKIEDITGKTVKIFRPPFGDYNDTLLTVADGLKLKTIQWSIDSLDWKERGKQDLVDRVVKKVKAGDIILCHNNSKYIVEALPEILDAILNKGLTPVPVSELVYGDNYIIDTNGVQRKK